MSGVVIPSSALSIFNGEDSAGTWILKVVDGYDGDGGSINSWSLDFCTLSALGVQENIFKDFTLFPNPNNGNFNIRFSTVSNNNINITVNDISGRQVYQKTYQNTGVFDQNINLDYLQAGIYLVTIGDGTAKTVKRIIVN